MKVLIVGGVAGGAGAAARISRLDETTQIIMFEKGEYISYANCGLPYYIGDVIIDKEKLTLNKPESLKAKFNIDVRINTEVIEVFEKEKTIEVRNLKSGVTYKEGYDKLILAPGAKAVCPRIDGFDDKKVFSLRTVNDTMKIKEYVSTKKLKTAVIIGAGFIGLEMAENLKQLGIDVTVVEVANQILKSIDKDMAGYLQGYLKLKGLNFKLNSGVTGFMQEDNQYYTVVNNEKKISSDIVLLAMGVTADTEFIKNSNIAVNDKGGIKVNEKMETSIKDIYAVGDAVEVTNFVTGKPSMIPLAGPANKQGRIVANNIYGIEDYYEGTQGSSIIKLFDITVAQTGINEKQAIKENLDYDVAILCPPAHAVYYPKQSNIATKVVFEKKTGKILGAQLIGFEGVDKRCDVFAVAIKCGLSAKDLTRLELCYAPPYSSAKDPVNMAGYIIENLVSGFYKQVRIENVVNNLDKVLLLDVRKEDEYAKGHINEAINIPLDELRYRFNEIPKDKPIYVICKTGHRSYMACRILMQNGYDCTNVAGGFYFYANVMCGVSDIKAMHSCGVDIEISE